MSFVLVGEVEVEKSSTVSKQAERPASEGQDQGGQEDEQETPGIFELIRRVGNRRLLYDSEDQNHKDRGRVSSAWKEVASGLKVGSEPVNVKWCRDKWKKLRDYYMRKKRESIKRSGAGRGQKITWQYYTAINSILRTCATENDKTVSNFDDDDIDIQSIGEIECDQQTLDDPPLSKPTETAGSSGSSNETPTSNGGKKRRRSATDTDTTEKLIQLFKETNKEEDEAFHFGMTVAATLRKLSPRSNRKAQMKIQRVLYNIEFSDNESE